MACEPFLKRWTFFELPNIFLKQSEQILKCDYFLKLWTFFEIEKEKETKKEHFLKLKLKDKQREKRNKK